MGKLLIIAGIVLIVIGIVVLLTDKWQLLGHLPGDIEVTKGNFSFHFPIMTSLLISVVATIILNILFRR